VSSTDLPLSGRFAVWFAAWASGQVSLDDARDAIVAGDAAHDVVGVPSGPTEPVPLIVALGLLRGCGASGAGVALPVPGDPLGLAGPATFNQEALEAGEAVVLEGADLGLVPRRAGAGVVWTCRAAISRRQVPDPAESDTGLRQALLGTAQALADLDVARWRPEVADELMALRRPAGLPLPDHLPPRAVRLASTAARCLTIVGLALDDEGGAITAWEADQRRQALAPLEQAARRAMVAACSSSSWR
jgi:hypothetical protein